MADISSPDDLEKWLQDKPIEWAQVIALRCSMRVIPVLNLAITSQNYHNDLKNKLTLSVFRASLISNLAVYPSTLDARDAALAAADTAAAAAHATAHASADVAHSTAPAAPNVVYVAHAVAHAARASVETAHTVDDATNAVDAALASARDTDAAFRSTDALNYDVSWLKANCSDENSPHLLLFEKLWYRRRNSLVQEWDLLNSLLLNQSPNWQFWTDWYQAIRDGSQYPDLNQAQQDDLYYQIATFPNELWEEGAEAVNQRIAELLEEVKEEASNTEASKEYDFFLSYSTKDGHLAALIADIILQEGYSVFAQFNDMPVGSNFIIEMQEGLENSSRFICLYSEVYKQSSACQAEWAAAFNEDRDGKKRNIISFLIENVSPPPLAKQIVHKNIIGMSTEEVRRAVLEAIKPAVPQTKIEARAYAKEAVSPVPYTNSEGKLDVQANKEFDQQILTEQLEKLPKRQIKLVEHLLAGLKHRNIVPNRVCVGLESYKEEFEEQGVQPDIELLNDQIELIELDLAGEDANQWVDETVTRTMEKLRSNHKNVQTHFPLDIERQTTYRDSPIDPKKLPEKYFSEQMDRLETLTKQFKEEHLATKEFLKFRKNQNEEIQQLLNIDASLFKASAEDSPTKPKQEVEIEDSKKRRLSKVSGFLDRLTDILSKSDKFAKSPTAQKMLETAKELSDWLWS